MVHHRRGGRLQYPAAVYSDFDAEDFVELVTPELQRRGLFRTEYETTTLRDHLGLGPVGNWNVAQRAMQDVAD